MSNSVHCQDIPERASIPLLRVFLAYEGAKQALPGQDLHKVVIANDICTGHFANDPPGWPTNARMQPARLLAGRTLSLTATQTYLATKGLAHLSSAGMNSKTLDSRSALSNQLRKCSNALPPLKG